MCKVYIGSVLTGIEQQCLVSESKTESQRDCLHVTDVKLSPFWTFFSSSSPLINAAGMQHSLVQIANWKSIKKKTCSRHSKIFSLYFGRGCGWRERAIQDLTAVYAWSCETLFPNICYHISSPICALHTLSLMYMKQENGIHKDTDDFPLRLCQIYSGGPLSRPHILVFTICIGSPIFRRISKQTENCVFGRESFSCEIHFARHRGKKGAWR